MAPHGYIYQTNISMSNRIKKVILKFKFDLKNKLKKEKVRSLKGTEFSKRLLEYFVDNYNEERITISDISRWINCYDWIMDMGDNAYPPGKTGKDLYIKIQQQWKEEEKKKKKYTTSDYDWEEDTWDENENSSSEDFPLTPPKLRLQVQTKTYQTRSSPKGVAVAPKPRGRGRPMKNVVGNTNGSKMTGKKRGNVPYKLPPRNSKTSNKSNPESVDPTQEPSISPNSSNISIFQVADIRSPPKAPSKIYPSTKNPGNRALISTKQPDKANEINSNQSKSPSERIYDFDPLESWSSPTLDKRQYHRTSKKKNPLPSNNSKSINTSSSSEPLISGQQNVVDPQRSESESFKAMVDQIRDTYLGVPRSNSIQRVQVEMNEIGEPRLVITVPHSEADRIMGSANECRVLCEMDGSLHSRLMQSDLIRTNQNDVGSGSSETVINQNSSGSQPQLDDLNNQPGYSSRNQPEQPGIHVRNSGGAALNLDNSPIIVNESTGPTRSNLNQIPSNESIIADEEITAVPIAAIPNEPQRENRAEEILQQLQQIHETFEYLGKMKTFFSQAEGQRLRCLIPSLKAMYRALTREHKRIMFPEVPLGENVNVQRFKMERDI